MPNTKQDKPFSEKLKAFFRVGKAHGFPRHPEDELVLSSEVLAELGSEQPVGGRLRAIRELQGQVRTKRLQEHGVELLWYKVEDLLAPEQDRETRHVVWAFVIELVLGQQPALDMLRPQLFRFLRAHAQPEDLGQRVAVLGAVTDSGKEILHIEEQMGHYVLDLLDTVQVEEMAQMAQMLGIASNMVRYNSAYLDQDVVVGLIGRLADVAVTSSQDVQILACLDTLKCVVMYSYVPPEALVAFIVCVCRVVNLASVSGEAWDAARKLLGTHLGHSALYSLCQIVQSPVHQPDTALVRGAILIIGRSLWGEARVTGLRYSAMSVLPYFLPALDCPHPLVLFEVAVQVRELVRGEGEAITAPEWEEVVSLLERLVARLDRCHDKREEVVGHLQEIIARLEALAMTEAYAGSRTRLYGLVESVASLCPEATVLHLLSYLQATVLHPARGGWLQRLAGVVHRFYGREDRRAVRLGALTVLREVATANLALHGDRLLELAVLPHLAQVEEEPDRQVRLAAVELVAELAGRSPPSVSRLPDLLELLERACRRFGSEERQLQDTDTAVLYTREDFDYQRAAVIGISRCLRANFLTNGLLVRRCYYALVTVLDTIYDRPAVVEHTGEVRQQVLRTLLAIRADREMHLGLPGDEGGTDCRFSPVIVCERPAEGSGGEDSGLTVLSLTRGCMAVIRCLGEEPDWAVLGPVLLQLPSTLQNKGMISRYGRQIQRFAEVLVSLFLPSHPLPTINTPPGFGRSDYQGAIYPMLAALASYNRQLEPAMQRQLIKCFEYGLVAKKCMRECMVALTACILEMSGTMFRLLPEVLINLSKISATTRIAIPILEFLSTLSSLPQVFGTFNFDQYLSVFAVTLPYTNPFKFNHYTVSLAHHVIVMWFLKCRLPFRKECVRFIIKGLGQNVLKPFEEGNFRKADDTSLSSLNQDSSSRQRSSSLREAVPSRRTRHNTGIPSRPTLNRVSGPDERQALLTFHQELTDTCIDLMARYTASDCGVQPRRGPVAEQLLARGTASSWLVGNSIVTITVSGCAQVSTKAGLCDACRSACQPEERRRHQSEQSGRVRQRGGGAREDPVIQPLGSEAGMGAGRAVCGCWCSGWCEVLVRRPSGVTSWVARVQNGLLSNHPLAESELSLRDVTELLRPPPASGRTRVKRANSNPELEVRELAARLELDLASVPEQEEGPEEPQGRARAATISGHLGKAPRPQDRERTGLSSFSPQFVFLQLYHSLAPGGGPAPERPLLLPADRSTEGSLRNLDRIFCYETHKVGVLYVGLGQQGNERAILGNQFGSTRYSQFLSGLGTLVDITATDPSAVYMGGLDPRDDGQFHYIWQEDAMQVVYHTATLMPNTESDVQFNKKKRHIGNDYVAIVYNESGHPYTLGTVKGQFIYAVILVEPLDFESNRMSVLAKPELESDLGHLATSKVVSDQNIARLTRQIALHCGLAAVIFDKGNRTKVDPYASNWLERLRHIKRLKSKVQEQQKQEEDGSSQLSDFTGYI